MWKRVVRETNGEKRNTTENVFNDKLLLDVPIILSEIPLQDMAMFTEDRAGCVAS